MLELFKSLFLSEEAPSGRETPMQLSPVHHVNGRNMLGDYPPDHEIIVLGMGCFWGAERAFWTLDGVWVTAVGYAGGITPNPSYQEVCAGKTGHTEVVLIVFNPSVITCKQLLKQFFERHDPTQGMRQGNDIGTQYRSAIYFTTDEQEKTVREAMNQYQKKLKDAGFPSITTEVVALDRFYFAEEYHQQYLSKNPGGYCGLKGTGVTCG